MLGGTGNSQYDLRFNILGIPVRIIPFFWLVAIVFSPFLGQASRAADMRLAMLGLLAWVAAWLCAFIVHEMGHALVVKYRYGATPSIVLYGFGGVTTYQPYYTRRPGNSGSMLISFAGPAAALLSVVVILVVLALFRVPLFVSIDSFGPIPVPCILPNLGELGPAHSVPTFVALYFLQVFLFSYLWMGTFWSVLNLLPIHPLDGGHMARAFLQRVFPVRGLAYSLSISIACSLLLLGYCLMEGNYFMAMFFGMFAMSNYREMKIGVY